MHKDSDNCNIEKGRAPAWGGWQGLVGPCWPPLDAFLLKLGEKSPNSAYQYSAWQNEISSSCSVNLWTKNGFFRPNAENKEKCPFSENNEKLWKLMKISAFWEKMKKKGILWNPWKMIEIGPPKTHCKRRKNSSFKSILYTINTKDDPLASKII